MKNLKHGSLFSIVYMYEIYNKSRKLPKNLLNHIVFLFADIQSWWEIPCISHFCSLFSSAFDLPDIDIEVSN